MANEKTKAGYLNCGIPYCRLGHGPRPLVVFQGLMFENKPPAGMMSSMYKFLADEYTIHVVLRKPGLPQGTSMKDMADAYARMIREEFGGRGGCDRRLDGWIDRPALCRRPPRLGAEAGDPFERAHTERGAKALQMQWARLAQERKWIQAYVLLIGSVFPQSGYKKILSKPVVWLAALMMGGLTAPKVPNDLVVTVEAEDRHNFRDRLGEIQAPTLVIAGVEDPFYTEISCPRDGGRHPPCKADPLRGDGAPSFGEAVPEGCAGFLAGGGCGEVTIPLR